MMPGVTIWRCTGCNAALFPERLLCPHCHGARFENERVHEATVEEISVIRHMLGQENWQPRRIANVRVTDDLCMTVGLLDESGPGARIVLFQEGEAPYGRAK
ncbi:MAG: hypothetical protein FJX62_00900 [Alphaproteobacteria bacterium]|nr:hypothetical protein [Alphaproteobacteria bacterium]